MDRLIEKAAINVMVTSQPTGLKLKLLHALYHGGHCIVNNKMLVGTGLDKACTVADTPPAMIRAIDNGLKHPFDEAKRAQRIAALAPYDNARNIHILSDLLEKELM